MSEPELVTFDADGNELAGHLYRPDGDGPWPAVVVSGSWLTVKEQMAGLHARALAEYGYVALAFDFTGTGASQGQPRDTESAALKTRDLQHAISFLARRSDVRADRIGALGICASAGYAADSAAADSRVRSLALVAPWLHDAELVEVIYGGKEGVDERMAAGEAARLRYEATDEVEYVPAVSRTDPTAAMYGPFEYYLDPERGAVPQWPNKFAVMAWPEWLTYSAIPTAPALRVPTLLVHSEDGAIPDGARRFHAGLTAPSEFVWLTGDQMAFYDDEKLVAEALEHVVLHFRATL
ncbi:CocE/NonD family hydrolase [Kribbella sp. NPDC056861]|uniref:alpha/beta hydrolase n=1 Tax=Kribbella sp. NPDC056861 TaxID=3154857 RepID=UPI003420642F